MFTLVSVGRGFASLSYHLNKLPTLGTLINTAYESDAVQHFDTIMMTLLSMYVKL